MWNICINFTLICMCFSITLMFWIHPFIFLPILLHAYILNPDQKFEIEESMKLPSFMLILSIFHESQVYAIPYFIWTALPSWNWRDFICPFYVNKQLRSYPGIIRECWIGFDFESLFGFFWQLYFRHCYSSSLHFHSNRISVFGTKGSYRIISIDSDRFFSTKRISIYWIFFLLCSDGILV